MAKYGKKASEKVEKASAHYTAGVALTQNAEPVRAENAQ